jgi:hypothetical protein
MQAFVARASSADSASAAADARADAIEEQTQTYEINEWWGINITKVMMAGFG